MLSVAALVESTISAFISESGLISTVDVNVETPETFRLLETVKSRAIVTSVFSPTVMEFPARTVMISFVVPATCRVSLSKSIESAPPLSAMKSKSCAVTC